MKVLMFGWEFPPKIYGGLAVASYGITKGLSLQGDMETIFCMPKPSGEEEKFLKIIGMNQVPIVWRDVNYDYLKSRLLEMTPEEYYSFRDHIYADFSYMHVNDLGCVMLGYYKDPEATAETIDKDGWLHTGDLARVDEEGYYYMTGRKKNLIILDSGENVSPEELEKLLGKCDAIKECIVKEMGKKIGTVVCCEDDKQQQVKEFVTELNRTLPMYKRISVVECSAEPLPRNALGKLLRK